jgi:biofilm PGA synthesis protein PgaD
MSQTEPDRRQTDSGDNQSMLIIDRPELVQPEERYTAWGITLFFWGVLLYLWQPALSLVAWSFNIKLFYQHMVVLGGMESFLSLLELYAMVIAILGGALLVWAKINELRFRGKVRRAQVSEIHTQQLIEAFDIPDLDLPQLKTEKVLYVYMKNDGQVIDINNKKI